MSKDTDTAKKVLIVDRGAFGPKDIERLVSLGFSIVFSYNVDGIRSVGDVPLRDYFAAAALSCLAKDFISDTYREHDAVASKCYLLADAMLAERGK